MNQRRLYSLLIKPTIPFVDGQLTALRIVGVNILNKRMKTRQDYRAIATIDYECKKLIKQRIELGRKLM